MKIFITNGRLAGLAGVPYDTERIQPGPIVYTRTHEALRQFSLLRQFPECVLVTSFSDAIVTNAMATILPPNVRKWFSNNVASTLPQMEAVPIGIRLSSEVEAILKVAVKRGRLSERNLVYLNCLRRFRHVDIPIQGRLGIYERFGSTSWITVEGGFEHVPVDQFYKQIASHPYVLSPPGAGPDCHRHWESIILGSIPIVKRCPVTRILDDFPCLQVDDWEEVTEARLHAEYEGLMERFHTALMEKVWFEYWQKRITEA